MSVTAGQASPHRGAGSPQGTGPHQGVNPLERDRSPSIPDAERWLEECMQQHWSRVYAVLYRLLGDDGEAQDLALEAFWRLHRRGPLVNPAGASPGGANVAGWLYRVAVNLGLNALRARQRRRQYEAQAGRQALEQTSPADPATLLEQAEERQRVRAALAKMKPRSASLLALRYSGLSYAEIAAALDLAATSVGALLARAEAEFERRYKGE